MQTSPSLLTRIAALPDAWLLLALGLALIVLRAALTAAAGLELHFDEAQYWTWSQRLDWGYYSKGPLVAWLIALGTSILGDNEIGVRLLGWTAYSVLLAVVFRFAREVWESRAAGWWAVALFLTTPLYFVLGEVMSTDIFLFLGWTVALWSAWRALYRERPNAWILFGLAIGMAALGKLSVGLLPFFLGPWLLFTVPGRRALATPQFWIGILLIFACMAPMLGWNAQNDWVTLRHEVGHVADAGERYGLAELAEFLLLELIALSPIAAIPLLVHSLRWPDRPDLRLLWGISLLTLGFFLFKSLSGKVQPNWPAPAYIGLLILFAGQLPHLSRGWRRTWLAGVTVYALLLAVAFFPQGFGLPAKKDPLKEVKAWRAPIAAIAAQAPDVDFLLTYGYQLASQLEFYWPEHRQAFLVSYPERRYNQFDLWGGLEGQAGRTGVFIWYGPTLFPAVEQAFERCAPLTPAPATHYDGTALRTLYAWRCEGFRPVDWPKPGWY